MTTTNKNRHAALERVPFTIDELLRRLRASDPRAAAAAHLVLAAMRDEDEAQLAKRAACGLVDGTNET